MMAPNRLPDIQSGAVQQQKDQTGMLRRVFRFRDLQKMGVVQNWPTLTRWIEKQGFPTGRLLGPNTRAWNEEEIEAWLADRPIGRKLRIRGEEDPPPENEKPAPLRQEGSRRVVKKEDRHQSSTASDSAAQATSREEEE